MKIRKIIQLITFFCFLSILVFAEDASKVNNEWNNEVLSHQITPSSIKDFILNSKLNGFIEVVLSRKPIHATRYLNISNISEINKFSYGVYIEWKGEKMKNGKGYMVTTLFIPEEIQSPEETINQLRNAFNK